MLHNEAEFATFRRNDDHVEAHAEQLEVWLIEYSDFSDVILDVVKDFWIFISFSSVLLLLSSSSSSSFKAVG